MWILPKSITSAFVQATGELISASVEQLAQGCEQSLIRRSKPTQSKIYLREWKAGRLKRLQFGVISKPFLGARFTDWWTSSLAAILANHSAPQESAPDPKTHDIFGPTSQAEFAFFSPDSASLKTSKGMCRWDSPQSSVIWKAWVTEQRGDYSARLKLALHTNESGCSSWPTAKARDWKDTTGCSLDAVNPDGSHRNRRDRLVGAIAALTSGQRDPDNNNSLGSRPASWATPEGMEGGKISRGGKRKNELLLTGQVKAWATATVSTGAHRQRDGSMTPKLDAQVVGKLNPNWVETLMGLPIGWTDCDSSATA
jgi:hypothetical protein